MKNYNQIKKGGFFLKKEIYAKTVREIQCYGLFLRKANVEREKSFVEITKSDIEDAVIARRYLDAIKKGLHNWVIEDYRKPVFEHVVYGTNYRYLEMKYFLSTGTMKRWVQRFIYGVARELGEDFS